VSLVFNGHKAPLSLRKQPKNPKKEQKQEKLKKKRENSGEHHSTFLAQVCLEKSGKKKQE